MGSAGQGPEKNAAGLPEDEYVVGTLWFGEAAAQPDAPSKRLPMEEVLIRHD